MKKAIKIDPVEIDIKNGTDIIYQFERQTVVRITGKYGKAFMTVATGTWLFHELKKDLGWLAKLLVKLGFKKQAYFVRATRVS